MAISAKYLRMSRCIEEFFSSFHRASEVGVFERLVQKQINFAPEQPAKFFQQIKIEESFLFGSKLRGQFKQ